MPGSAVKLVGHYDTRDVLDTKLPFESKSKPVPFTTTPCLIDLSEHLLVRHAASYQRTRAGAIAPRHGHGRPLLCKLLNSSLSRALACQLSTLLTSVTLSPSFAHANRFSLKGQLFRTFASALLAQPISSISPTRPIRQNEVLRCRSHRCCRHLCPDY